MKYKFDQIAVNSTSKKKPVETDKEHYIGLEHLDSNCFTVSRWGADAAPVGEKLIMKKGDILFGKRRAYQRKVAIAPFDGIFSAHGMVLRPKTDVIDPDYFPFFLSSDYFMETAIRISVGGLSPTINWKDLKEQEFNLPSLEEQKVLAEELWAAYRLKEAYQRLLNATDEMVKSQFLEMFGNEDTISLGEVASYINGSAFKPEDWSDNGLPIVRIQNLTNNDTPYNYYAGPLDKKIIIDNGDVLISWSATLDVFEWQGGKACLNQHIFKVEFDKLDVNKEFFIYTIKTALSDIVDKAHGSTMRHIVKKDFDKTLVKWPSKIMQEQFAEIVRQADKSKFELRKAISAIDEVIKSLINV